MKCDVSESDEREGKKRYDRQVRLWGRDAQQKIQGMTLSLDVGSGEASRMTGNGIIQEISKSMVLTGVNALTLIRIGDNNRRPTFSDVECGYFSLPRRRSECNDQSSLLTLQSQIAELNPLVKVETGFFPNRSSWFQQSVGVDHYISLLGLKELSSLVCDIILNNNNVSETEPLEKKPRVEKTEIGSKLHVICQLGKYAFAIISNEFNSSVEKDAVAILVRSFFSDIFTSTEGTISSLPMSFHVILLAALLISDDYPVDSFPRVYLRCVELQQKLASKGYRFYEGVSEEVVRLMTSGIAPSAVTCSISGGILCQIILQSVSSTTTVEMGMVTHTGEIKAKSWTAFEIGNVVEALCS